MFVDVAKHLYMVVEVMSSYKQTMYFLLPPFHPSLFVFLAFNLLVCMAKNENAFTLLNLHRKEHAVFVFQTEGLLQSVNFVYLQGIEIQQKNL